MTQRLSRFLVSILSLLALAWSTAGPAHPAREESGVRAYWERLEHRDDAVRLARPGLDLRLENPTGERVAVRARARLVIDGRVTRLPMRRIRLEPGRGRTVRVPLPPGRVVGRHGPLFAGKLTLALETRARPPGKRGSAPYRGRAGRPGGHAFRAPRVPPEPVSIGLPALYFHPAGGKLLVYREGVLRERFGAGNFRGLELPVPEFFTAWRDDLARAGLGGLEPLRAFVHLAPTLPGLDPEPPDDVLPPGSRKFCYGLEGESFDDSGEVSQITLGPPSEDFGREGELVPAARAWVALGQLGAPLFTGFLDAQGCTPYVVTDPVDPVSTAFFPLYLRTSNDIRGFVSDLNLGPQWPDSMPYFLFFFPPGGDLVQQVLLDPEEYVNTIYVAAANAMERVPGGRADVLYEFRLREAGDNQGTNTFYAAEGHPQVRIKYSAAARSKFTIAHEYGHALHIGTLSPPLTPDDLDYSVTASEGEQHTVTSKEWQLAAAVEGFGHFVSALAWNAAVPDDEAIFRSGGTTYELDEFTRRFETSFDAAQFPHQGVELDWAQLFWNYHTDVFEADGETVLAPPVGAIVDMWLAAYPWPVNEGFFDDLRDGVEIIAGTFGPANPVEEGLLRFDAIADLAGVDH